MAFATLAVLAFWLLFVWFGNPDGFRNPRWAKRPKPKSTDSRD